ncbi:MAG: phosphotransferase family protein [Desulfobulbus sp.]|jgi:hypothetical protein
MLNNVERRLVAAETALPGLGALLDAPRTLELVRRLWPEQRLEDVTCTYLKYKPGTNCLAGYRARNAQETFRLSLKAFTPERHARLRPEAHRRDCDRLCVVGRIVPSDRKLPELALWGRDETRRERLIRLVPDMPWLHTAALEPLRYKPERRYVGRLVSAGTPLAVVKVYERRDFDRALFAARCVDALQPPPGLRLARSICSDPDQCAIVSWWLPGTGMDGLLRDGCPEQTVLQLGAALAWLHGQEVCGEDLPGVCSEDEADAVCAAAEGVAQLYPECERELLALAGGVATALAAGPTLSCLIHGDFSADQVLVREEDVAIVDYDQLARGNPAMDLGTCLAQAEYREGTGLYPPGTAAAFRAALLAGYGPPPSGTELHLAAGLLRLVAQGFRDRDPKWPEHVRFVIRRAGFFFREALRSDASAPDRT